MSLITSTIRKLDLDRFLVGEGPQQQPITLHQKKVYILPTKYGLIFALLLIVMLIGSINYNNSLGYMLTFLLASLSIITILFTYRNLLNLKISIGKLDPVYCEQKIIVPFIFNDVSYERFSLSLSYNRRCSLLFDLTPGTYADIEFHISTDKRGEHNLKKFTFSTTFPLGLFRAWSYFEVNKNYLVYPKPAGKSQLPEQALYKATLYGDQGQGTDDFAGQRKYNPGDSLKHVNWKSLAKEQDLLTKQFGGDRCEELWLDWSSIHSLPLEDTLSQLALWIIEAERLGYSYGLKLPGQEIHPAHGEHQLNKCMVSLALFGKE